MNKFVFFILTSSNHKLLKVCYNTVINQKNHNIDYDIIIVVNSLNSNYINDVSNEFQNIDVEIIQTQSNGKPGMGHNSLINIFNNRPIYDYMLMIDGDDFLYPYALNQLQKCFDKQKHIDMLVLKSTDKLKFLDSNNHDFFNIYINNNFYIESKIYVDYKLYPWNYEHMNLSNMYQNSLCTPIRLFLLSRKILKYTKSLFCEKSQLYDDYLLFLNFIKFSQYNDLNAYIIPGKYIYIYNCTNNLSQTNTTDNQDLIYYNDLKSEFAQYCNFLGNNWDLTKLPTLYISHFYNIDYKYTINESLKNISMNINLQDLYNDPNYIYIKNTGNQLITEITNSYYKIIETSFLNNDFNNSIKYTKFYIDYNIINPYISFIYIYSLFNLYPTSINSEYISSMKKHIKIAKSIIDLYNIQKFNEYCKHINQI